MFRIFFSTSILLLAILAATAQQPASIQGVYDKSGDGLVTLYRVEAGNIVPLATYQADQSRKFGFQFFPPYKGWYVLGTGNEKSPSDKYTFYFKGGEQLSVSLKQNRYEMTGTANSPENRKLYTWNTLSDSVFQKSVNFSRYSSIWVDFFPQLEQLVLDARSFIAKHAAGNDLFSRQLRDLVKMDLLQYSNQFLNTPRASHPGIKDLSPFYQSMNVEALTKGASLFYSYPWGTRTLGSMLLTGARQKGMTMKPGLDGFREMMLLVTNDTLKGDLALERMASIKGYGDLQQYLDVFGKCIVTPLQVKEKLKRLQALEPFKTGNAGYDFAAINPDGKKVRLSELSGKLVLVDVWATWCGPCKKEEPFWEKLTERFAGKDIVFTGLSIDQDKEAWKKYLSGKKLKGLQLHIGESNELSAVYKISGIPRYLLFDKDGRIINIDAPRPSDEALTALIEEWLTK
ncbi:MAG: TlpA family protein disulfide reductase [Chitinophagaceae bacterium]|nr:TlpA family protein disulfide reductase [Chitinophagaceae bacterium]